ncbi:GNAT family N-acetyltransferase [Streptomyces sp. NPDC051555]|uniref:GNAT family N-acetyltransferase n=1 Tax=Streptomyces sp. NPDC051555 TaxID=3365657 RepID=UPI00378EF6C5
MDDRVRTPSRITFAGELQEELCEELAALAQRRIAGFSDDRPVNVALVRSRLTNALTGTPPVLAVARKEGRLIGWCGVRRPEPGEARARLWGPVVDPAAGGRGLGRLLLNTVVGAVPWPLVTTDVPADRPGAAGFFTRAGWEAGETITVMHTPPTDSGLEAATAEGASALDAFVAAAARRYAGHEEGFAMATLARWRDDARFRAGNLLLDPKTGSLLLALVQRNTAASELLLAEVWADAPDVRRHLIGAAITLAARQQVAAVRAVTRQDPADFVACGMAVTGRCNTFTPPGQR